MTFDAALAATSAADFIERILVGRFGIGGAAIGFDFHFGKNRAGSPAYLAEQGARLGFAVDIVPPLEDEGRPVSSGAVRTALSQGKVVEAAELLGAPWFVSGEVIHGDKRGRELGFPTANVQARSGLRPQARHLCGARRRRRASAMTGWRISACGRCSTAARRCWRCSCSTSTATSTARCIDVAFIGWIRHEQKFDSIEVLKRHIAADGAQARDALKRAGKAFPVLGEI